jgi:hypothetical protein
MALSLLQGLDLQSSSNGWYKWAPTKTGLMFNFLNFVLVAWWCLLTVVLFATAGVLQYLIKKNNLVSVCACLLIHQVMFRKELPSKLHDIHCASKGPFKLVIKCKKYFTIKIVQKLRMSGVILQIPCTPSWHALGQFTSPLHTQSSYPFMCKILSRTDARYDRFYRHNLKFIFHTCNVCNR